MKKQFFWLLVVFVLGFLLRFYRLGEVPLGFHRDEAFLGYNAYSILKTGRDINGNFLPLHLQSFLYSPAGYSYAAIPSVALFGLSPFAVRLPAALFGSLTILVTYFLVKEFFYRPTVRGVHSATSEEGLSPRCLGLPLAASFFLAISPWHINLSRTATENVIVVFFLALGAWLYLRSRLIPAFVCFGLTLVLYQAPRAFLPLFLPILIFKTKAVRKTQLITWSLFFLLIVLPLLAVLFSETISLRMRTVTIFSSPQAKLLINEQISQDGIAGIPIFLTRLFHNKPITYLNQFLKNYFAHFSFDFLFTDRGFPDRYRVPLAGLLYLFELPLLFIGLWHLPQLKEGMLIAWLLLSPLGSALAFDDVPNLQRTLIIFPALSIILAFGWLQLSSWLNKKRVLKLAILPFGLVAGYLLFFYLHQYYLHFSLYRPWYRHDGYQELVQKVNQLLPAYQKAVITNRESAPTIFFLFFGQYDPAEFQKETAKPAIKDFDRIDFGKYQFSQEECPLKRSGEEKVLYVNSGLCQLPAKNIREISQIRRKDNSLVFRILEYQP